MDDFAFILKKVIGFLLKPYGIILLCIAISLILSIYRRYMLSRLSLLVALLALLLFANPYIASILAKSLEHTYAPYVPSTKSYAPYIIALGSGHMQTNTPISSSLSSAGTKRVLEAIHIYNQHPYPKPMMIFTGYAGFYNQRTYADMAGLFAEQYGIPWQHIHMQGTEKDTLAEAKTVKRIVGDNKVIVVSSAMHLPRAMAIFNSEGIQAIPAPTDYKYMHLPWYAMPTITHLQTSNLAIHEYLGRLWYTFQQLF